MTINEVSSCPVEDQWILLSSITFDTNEQTGPIAVARLQDSAAMDKRALHPIVDSRIIGSVYGLAYDWRSHLIYVSAYHKSDYDFLPRGPGPGGPGAIYRVDPWTGSASIWTTLDAGASPHDSTLRDDIARPWVGKTSLGTIEVVPEANLLFVMNLYDRRIYRLSTIDASLSRVFDHGAANEAWAANARPFGMAIRDGWLYHGVVDSREDASLPGDLRGYIYRTDFEGDDMTLVAEFILEYARYPRWVPWSDRPFAGRLSEAQPIISDIEFTSGGDLIIGLRAREVDANFGGYGYGDILSTRKSGSRWVVVTSPEHYRDNLVRNGNDRELIEAAFGGLASVGNSNTIVASINAPFGDGLTDGVVWYDNATGIIAGPVDGRERVVMYSESPSLGDVEFACIPATPPHTATPPPSPTATPTATPSPSATATVTSTPTPSPTATPTAIPSPSPSPTPALARHLAYLPLAQSNTCLRRSFADIALVIDVSTSMQRPTTAGRAKLDATLAAVRGFLDQAELSPGRDRVAIVGFNETAWIAAPLTADRGPLDIAVRALPNRMAEGTRLDLALARGVEAISGGGPPVGRSAALVLLTDGLPNRVPTPVPAGAQEDTVLAEARRAKALGIGLYTIGVGRADAPDLVDRINPALLAAIASAPGQFYQTPDAEALAAIYASIARAITCGDG
jgi:hypothetical protein